MRSLLRNQQPVFYKNLEGEEEIVDQYGNSTGTYVPVYGEEEIVDQYGNSTGTYVPVYGELKSAMLCVSPNKGATENEQFGTLLDYDRTMTTADTRLDIDETSILWVDGADTNGPWNYKVTKRAPWKNSIQFAIKQVSVSEYQEYQTNLESLRNKAVVEDAENND